MQCFSALHALQSGPQRWTKFRRRLRAEAVVQRVRFTDSTLDV